MSISAETPRDGQPPGDCTGCAGAKGAPLAAVVHVGTTPLALCEECGRDLANAVGFFCVKAGGWSKLEPRKRRTR